MTQNSNVQHNDYGAADVVVAIQSQVGDTHVYPRPERAFRFLPKAASTKLSHDRETLVRSIAARLLHQGDGAKVAITGPPGIGKTAVAAAIANGGRVRRLFPNVLTATIGPDGKTHDELLKWSNQLGHRLSSGSALINIAGANGSEPLDGTAIKAAISSELAKHGPTLIIVDNAWQQSHIDAFELTDPRCAYIFTTQHADLVRNVDSTPLPGLSEAEARELLKAYAPQAVDSAPRKATDLIRALGGIPLGLNLVGKHLRHLNLATQSRVSEAMDRLVAAADEVRDLDFGIDILCEPENKRSLGGAIAMSVDSLTPEAKEALVLISLFSPLPNSFSEQAFRHVTGAPDTVLEAIWSSSLLERTGPGRLAIHVIIDRFLNHLAKQSVYAEKIAMAEARFIDYYHTMVRERCSHISIRTEQANIISGLGLCVRRRSPSLFQFIRCLEPLIVKEGLCGSEALDGLLDEATAMTDAAWLAGSDQQDLVSALLVRAGFLEKLGRYVEAERTLKRLIELPRAQVLPEQLVKLMELVSVLRYDRADYSEAKIMLGEAAKLLEEMPLHARTRFSGIYRRMGEVALSSGEFKIAAEQFAKALEMVGDGDAEAASACYLGMGVVAFNLGDFRLADEYLSMGREQLDEGKHSETFAAILHMHAATLLRRVDAGGTPDERQQWFNDCRRYLGTGLRIARRNRHYWYLAALLNESGEFHRRMRTAPDRRAGRRALARAVRIAQKIGSPDREAFAMFSWAWLERDDGKLLAARGKARASLHLFTDMKHYMTPQAASLVRELARTITIADMPIVRPRAGGPGAPYARGF